MGKYVQAENAKSKYTVDVQAPAGVEPQFFPQLSPGMKRLMGIGETQTYSRASIPRRSAGVWRNDDQTNDSSEIVWMGPKNAASGVIRLSQARSSIPAARYSLGRTG